MKRPSKYIYEWVVQGWYGYGWDDLTYNTTRGEALADLRDYRANERAPHRIIHRRTPNPAYVK